MKLPEKNTKNHVLLPIRLVLVVDLQNLVHPFSLKITACSFLVDALSNSARCSEPFPAHFSEPLTKGM